VDGNTVATDQSTRYAAVRPTASLVTFITSSTKNGLFALIMIDARQLLDNFVNLGDHDAAPERDRFYNRRRSSVFSPV